MKKAKLGRPVEYTEPRARVACRVSLEAKAFLKEKSEKEGINEGKVIEMLIDEDWSNLDFRTKAFLEQRAKAKGMTEEKVVEMLTALYYYDTNLSKAFERVFHERGYDKISTIDGRVAVKQEMEKRR
jgi:hypothetical protein